VGCGPGTITADFAGLLGSDGHVIAIDNAEDVLEKARVHAKASGVLDCITFEAQSVYELPYEDASFDVVHAHQVLQHLSRPVDALKEMKRVCKPGGVVAARDADYDAFFWHPEMPLLDRWKQLYQELARDRNGEPNAGRKVFSWALEAGFKEIIPSSSTWCYADEYTRDWWGGLWADRITGTAIARQV